MADGKWRTLSEITEIVGGSETGVSARLRDLRKKQFGEYVVHLRRKEDPARGIWEYQLVTKDDRLEFKWTEANGQGAFL